MATKVLLALSTQLSSGDSRQMALAYGKKHYWFAGRSRLVAQTGGLKPGFTVRLFANGLLWCCEDDEYRAQIKDLIYQVSYDSLTIILR